MSLSKQIPTEYIFYQNACMTMVKEDNKRRTKMYFNFHWKFTNWEIGHFAKKSC